MIQNRKLLKELLRENLPVVAIGLAGWMGLGINTNNLEQIDRSKLARYGIYFAMDPDPGSGDFLPLDPDPG
jgi:hypothetical protein